MLHQTVPKNNKRELFNLGAGLNCLTGMTRIRNCGIYCKYSDKVPTSPIVSLWWVMKELSVTDIITGDEHFAHVEMGFRKCP